jgi:hypothetical protein
MDNADALIAALISERELSAADMVHAERAGKLQAQIAMLERLLEDSSLRPTVRVAICQQITTASNSLHKHLHELRQSQKRAERLSASPTPPSSQVSGSGAQRAGRPTLASVRAAARERHAARRDARAASTITDLRAEA